MTINVKVDDSKLLLRLRNGEKRLAFAVAKAINLTADDVQNAERARVLDEFEVRPRTRAFVLREAAIIKPRAQVGAAGRFASRPFAEIGVGRKPRFLLAEFEKGGRKEPRPGKRAIAVPVTGGPARPAFAESVPTDLYVSRLSVQGGRRKPRGGAGKIAAFIVHGIGIFLRDPAHGVGLLYRFVRSAPLRPRLHFVQTARDRAARTFPLHMRNQIASALARNR